jgi:HlyD family secretion protein
VRNRIIFSLAFLGMIAGLVSAYVSGTQEKPLPPAFSPAPNPYVKGIYTTGIIES